MPTRLRLAVLLAALWWGSLSAVALLVVPLLFHALPSPALAGGVAARLFSAQCWVALACGVALLLMLKGDAVSGAAPSARTGIVLVFLGLLLALLLEHGVAPRIVARHNLALWHGVGSAMVLAQWLGDDVGRMLPIDSGSETLIHIAGFVLVFVVSVFVGGMVVWGLPKLIEQAGLRPVDRVLGGAFGVLRAIILVLAMTVFVLMTPVKDQDWWRDSLVADTSIWSLKKLKPMLPESAGKYLP